MNAAELFFSIVDYDLLLKIANTRKISINGFKNINKVPEFIIRKNISLRFGHKGTLAKSILQDLYGSMFMELKKDNVEDFLYSFLSYPLRNKVPYHTALGLLILFFPEYADSMVEKFSDNLKNEKHIFAGCIYEPEIMEENCFSVMNKVLQLADEVDSSEVLLNKFEKLAERISKEDEYNELCKEISGLSFFEFSRKFLLIRQNYCDYLLLMAFIKTNMDEIKKSQEEIRNFYNKVIFKILECITFEVLVELEREIKEKNEYIKIMEEKSRDYQKSLETCENNLRLMNGKIKEYEEKINNMISFQELHIEENEQEAADIDGKFELIIITSYNYDRIFDVIGSYSIVHPEKVSELPGMLNGFEGMVFIDRGSINSTKKLIEIEKLIKSKTRRKFVIWAKSCEELVRNIIIKLDKLEG